MKKALTLAVGTTAALFISSSALAGKDSGFYVGGSIASSQFDSSQNDFGIDDDDTSYKIFGGYNFGWVPMFDVAAEASYVDFGKFGATSGDDEFTGESTGIMASGLGAINFGPIGLFGKVGYVNWDSDFSGFDTSGDDSGSDGAYGLGARVQIGSLSVRAEYEIFELGNVDVDYTSIGASFTF